MFEIPTQIPDRLGQQPLLDMVFREIATFTPTKQLIIWYVSTVKCICGLFKIINLFDKKNYCIVDCVLLILILLQTIARYRFKLPTITIYLLLNKNCFSTALNLSNHTILFVIFQWQKTLPALFFIASCLFGWRAGKPQTL